MKHKLLFLLLAAEAGLCMFLSIIILSTNDSLSALMSFPFEQLGLLLRKLSETGQIGNAFAVTLYTALCLSPFLFLQKVKQKRRFYAEDFLMVLLSAGLFITLFYMINPSYLSRITVLDLGDSGVTLLKFILGSLIWAFLLGYVILRLLRLSFANGIETLQRYGKALLYTLCFFFVFTAFSLRFTEMISSFLDLRSKNTSDTNYMIPTNIFYVLTFLVDILPNILYTILTVKAIDLLTAMQADRYSKETDTLAKNISVWCAKSLAAIICTSIIFPILQLLFAKILLDINTSINIPFLSLIFVLALLFVSRIISENRKLKTDNDLFI